jgi:hypothetical protein
VRPTIASRIPSISSASIRLRAAVGVTALACACSVGVAKAVSPPPISPSPPQATCDQHPGTTLLQSGSVVVYGTDAGTNALRQAVTRYWACALPTGSSSWVGSRASGGRYPPNATMRHVAIAGNFVAAVDSFGVGATAKCVADDGHFCRRPKHEVTLVDAQDGSSGSVSPAKGIGRLLVGADGRTGAAAWTQSTGGGQIKVSFIVTRSMKDSGESFGGTVAQGPIDPSSLSLDGTRLRYTEHGKTHSVNLARRL